MSDDDVDVDSIFGTITISSLIELNEDTSLLARKARGIAEAYVGDFLEDHPTISLGELLIALLDNASPEDTLNIKCSPLRYTAGVICGAHDDNQLGSVATVWLEYMLYPMKTARSAITTYPTEEQTPSLEHTATQMEPARRRTEFRKTLLRREGYRCAVYRNNVDRGSEHLVDLQPDDETVSKLQGCHIVPFSLNDFPEEGPEFRKAAITWTLLKHWTGFDIQQLVGEGLNDASNGILMGSELHGRFGAFLMHFEPATSGNNKRQGSEPNTYNILSVKQHSRSYPLVEFQAREGIAIPNPKLLAIHAAFARVLYASGAGRYFDQIWRDAESMGVLSPDGTSDIGYITCSLQMLAVRRQFKFNNMNRNSKLGQIMRSVLLGQPDPFSIPTTFYNNFFNGDLSQTPVGQSPNDLNPGPNFLMSWLLGMLWGDDSTVSVVDRTPILSFAARPAAFGPSLDVLGYMIRVEDFSIPCSDGTPDDNNTNDHDRGYPVDRKGTYDDNWKKNKPDLRKGCPPICFSETKRPESAETWIALVMRGGCTFVEKIREAQRLGAKGVVVGGETPIQDTHGDGLVQMYSLEDASDINIPSVYISHESYRTLSSLIASSNTSTWQFKTVSAVITIDLTGWQWYSLSPILTFLLLLFLPSILTLLTLLIHRCRAARAARRERAPEEIVQNLPWSVWEGEETVRELEKGLNGVKERQEQRPTEINSESSAIPSAPFSSSPPSPPSPPPQHVTQTKKWFERQVECAICLEDFVKGDKVRVLPCRHIFHMEEVDDWLIHRKKLCPICKHDVTCPVDVERTITREPASIPEPLSVIQQTTAEPTERTPLLNN
ncbi:hypothetical protein Clacol_010097 [Clathrus columnatus]|uniref:RING-type E3 ubiquitin transferase n=1 Tax=Clathrus columnatus TaxID=1419009 RepID=A0AAV5ASU2_9AGAM|nr:hypothetical protein Clacol_010097 [Clathrus columnatus]